MSEQKEVELPDGLTKQDIETAIGLVNSAGVLVSGVVAEYRVAQLVRDSRELHASLTREAALTKQVEEEEKATLEEIKNRDEWEDRATQLADEVGAYFDVPVGEHSSCNCPIEEARKILNGEYKTNSQKDKRIAELEAEFAAANQQAAKFDALQADYSAKYAAETALRLGLQAELAALREGAKELCAPRDRSPLWLLIYDDPEVGIQEYATEEEAREAYKKAIVSWNCTLYRPAEVITRERILDATDPKETPSK